MKKLILGLIIYSIVMIMLLPSCGQKTSKYDIIDKHTDALLRYHHGYTYIKMGDTLVLTDDDGSAHLYMTRPSGWVCNHK
jgi:hypothetical protein